MRTLLNCFKKISQGDSCLALIKNNLANNKYVDVAQQGATQIRPEENPKGQDLQEGSNALVEQFRRGPHHII